ncbi:MAG: MucR family transcriptional regulator [Phenylobacterium sp.]|nr:MucR family transcriptional regulator [Phenylobacterium sp.]MDP1642749.1 MucR family transcriptional regulator [Phenylobacterium sp.]MDP3117203.1 MucR family transcriptional regulator [Phenylobacterium sp.]
MEVGAAYEPFAKALNAAAWAAKAAPPAEEPETPLLAFHVGDVVSIGGAASGYRLLAASERASGAYPVETTQFHAQQVSLKTGRDVGKPRTITLHAIQGFVVAAALPAPDAVEESGSPSPAVPIEQSVRPDSIACLEDGRRFKSMTRHLRVKYNLSPEEYRAKWGLPADYPMVAPNYARMIEERRAQLAHEDGAETGPDHGEPVEERS